MSSSGFPGMSGSGFPGMSGSGFPSIPGVPRMGGDLGRHSQLYQQDQMIPEEVE